MVRGLRRHQLRRRPILSESRVVSCCDASVASERERPRLGVVDGIDGRIAPVVRVRGGVVSRGYFRVFCSRRTRAVPDKARKNKKNCRENDNKSLAHDAVHTSSIIRIGTSPKSVTRCAERSSSSAVRSGFYENLRKILATCLSRPLRDSLSIKNPCMFRHIRGQSRSA